MASVFISTPSEIVLIDSRTRSGVVTLPNTNQIAYRIVSFKDQYGSFSNSTMTLSTQTGETFDDGTTTKTFSNAFTSINLYATPSRWMVMNATQTVQQTISSLITNQIIFGTGAGWVQFGPVQATILSSIQQTTAESYISSLNASSILTANPTITRTMFLNDQSSHPFSNNYFYAQNIASTLQVGLSNYGAALFVNYRGGTANSAGRLGVGGTPVFGLDVLNGNFRVAGNTAHVGVQISTNANSYPITLMSGGNSLGFIWGAFNGWKPNGGDGMNLSYNFYNDDSVAFPSLAGNRIPNPAGQSSYLRLGYGEILFGTSTVNAPPQTRLSIDQFGTLNASAASTILRGTVGPQGFSRLVLGPSPGGVNYDYCSLIQSCNTSQNNFGSELSFWTHGNAGNFADPIRAMTINQAQQVGVNCNTPSYPLDVRGLTNMFASTMITNNTIGGQNTTLADYVASQITLGGGTGAPSGEGIIYGPTIRGIIPAGQFQDVMRLDITTSRRSNNNIQIPRISVLSGVQGGNVGINTSTPSVTLDVAGTHRNFSTVTSSVTLGLGAGWVQANALQAIALSSIQFNSALGYVSSLYVGSTTTVRPGYTAWFNGVTRAQQLIIGNTSSFTIPVATWDLQMVRGQAAAQPLATTWLVGSDKRIKENIVNADLDRCYNDLKNVPLRRYAYASSFFELVDGTDKHVLGFVAQEVSTIIPKAVVVGEGYGYSNFNYLNIDQLNMSLYGAVKKTIQDKEILESTVKGQRVELQTLQGTTSLILSTLEGLQGR